MPSNKIYKYQIRLKQAFKQYGEIPDELDYLKGQWPRYLCVLVSGYVEVAISTILSDYAEKCANKHVAKYVDRNLSRLQNANMHRIVEIIGQFNSDWGKIMEEKTAGQLKDSIDSIANNRNQIAHGQDVGIGFTQIKGYYDDAEKVIRMLQGICENSPPA